MMSCGALPSELEHWWLKRRAKFWRAENRYYHADHLDAQTIGSNCVTKAMLSKPPQKVVGLSGILEAVGHTLTVRNWTEIKTIKTADKDHPCIMKARRQPYAMCLHYGPTCRDTHLSASGI